MPLVKMGMRCVATCVGRGRTTGALGGGGGPGDTNDVISVAGGRICGQSIGARTALPTRATCPVTPTHVAQRRFDAGGDVRVDCSNMMLPPLSARTDTLLLQ